MGAVCSHYVSPESEAKRSVFQQSRTLRTAVNGPAPWISDVIISGFSSLHDPFSFATATYDNPATPEIETDPITGSGNQLRTVPVGAADTISIVFSEGVNVSANSLMVIGLTTATLPTLADFSYDVATFTATWRFEGWAPGDNYLMSLADSVTDVDGNLLDGEWTNPASINTGSGAVSTFPSGDGTPGGQFDFLMTLLPGDANLDGIVAGTDMLKLLSNLGMSFDSEEFQNGDFNGDGTVAGADLLILSSNLGIDLQDVWALADMDGDYDIDLTDLGIISGNIGMTGATWADGDLNGDGQVTLDDLDLAFLQYGLGLELVA